MITVINYGAGNLRSVENTLAELGASYVLTNTPEGVRQAEKLILPGVGHFGQMMRTLDELNLRSAILERASAGVPFLGICLGLQAMFEGSAEAPEQKGFGMFPGQIARFPVGARVPHMGWNSLTPRGTPRLLHGAGQQPYVYFAHSYYAPVTEATAASCHYELEYTAILEHRNVFGVQFHPEKSGPVGLRIVRNFVEI